MKRIFYILAVVLLVGALGPLIVYLNDEVDFSSNDHTKMSRESAQISPSPAAHPQALVQVFAARTFSWRGPFSVHGWIAVKPENASEYTVYELIGYRRFRGLPMVVQEAQIPDRYWYGNKPTLLRSISGASAQAIIPKIEAAAKSYPYPELYRYWPGPNSNTFIAYIARQVPELELTLPSTAIGKDYLPFGQFLTLAPSTTGYQFSLVGVLGLTLAKAEGIEFNFLGLSYGFSPYERTVQWPGIGSINY